MVFKRKKQTGCHRAEPWVTDGAARDTFASLSASKPLPFQSSAGCFWNCSGRMAGESE